MKKRAYKITLTAKIVDGEIIAFCEKCNYIQREIPEVYLNG